MDTVTIILVIVVILASLGYFLLRNKKEKEVVVIPTVDNPPVAEDNTIVIKGQSEYILTKKDLIFSDKDGNTITNVRFSGDIGEIYIDKNYTEKYVAYTELPIDLNYTLSWLKSLLLFYNIMSNLITFGVNNYEYTNNNKRRKTNSVIWDFSKKYRYHRYCIWG